jgi:hypothetical protein
VKKEVTSVDVVHDDVQAVRRLECVVHLEHKLVIQ